MAHFDFADYNKIKRVTTSYLGSRDFTRHLPSCCKLNGNPVTGFVVRNARAAFTMLANVTLKKCFRCISVRSFSKNDFNPFNTDVSGTSGSSGSSPTLKNDDSFAATSSVRGR